MEDKSFTFSTDKIISTAKHNIYLLRWEVVISYLVGSNKPRIVTCELSGDWEKETVLQFINSIHEGIV